MNRVMGGLIGLGLAFATLGCGAVQEVVEPGRVPSPEECQAAPRPVEEVLALVITDEPMPPRTPLSAPLGEPVERATKQAVAAVARELLACVNAGDELRAAALFTDIGVRTYVRRPAGTETVDQLQNQLAMTPEPRPEDARLQLVATTDASRLADGRVGAFLVFWVPGLTPPGPRTNLVVFAEDGDRWRIDDLYGFGVADRARATPSP